MSARHKNTILTVGTVFADKFQIVRMLGKGGMGEVYEAVERPLGRQVAVKVISESTASDEDLLRRFKLEGKALSLVNHPNIVTVYETGEAEGIHFISMEYVEGRTIHEICKTLIVPDNDFCVLFLQMCEGLRVLHAKNVIHRDIKPKNIIYQTENFIKILDFGIAKFYGDFTMHNTAVGVIVGTLLYMAPEVATGSKASFQSDIWSLGSIFYEMLTGTPLIQAKTTFEALNQLNNLKVKFPASCKGSSSPEMQRIVKKMCAKDTKKRYQTIDEVIEDLQAFSMSHPASERWMYRNMCKNVTNLTQVKRRLKSDGFGATQAKRILAEAIYESKVGIEDLQNQETMLADKSSGKMGASSATIDTRIDEETLQSAIIRVTAPTTAKKLEATDGGRREVADPDKTQIFGKTGEFLAETSEDLGRAFAWLKKGKMSNRLEWSLLAIAIVALIIAAGLKKKQVVLDEISEVVDMSTPRDIGLKSENSGEILQPMDAAIESSVELPAVSSENTSARSVSSASNSPIPDSTKEKPQADLKTAPPPMRPVPTRKLATKPPVKTTPKIGRIERLSPILLGSNTRFTFDHRSISSSTRDYSRFPRLNWNAVKGAVKYIIQISPDNSFRSLVLERIVKSRSSFDWKKAIAGRYFWRVQAVDRLGNKSRFSSFGQLQVMLSQPQLQPQMQRTFRFKSQEDYRKQKTEVDFRWAAVPRAWGYFVQMSLDSRFSKVAQEWFSSNNQHRLVTSTDGQYFFRIAAADAQKQRVSDYSRPMKLSVKRLLDVELPKLLTPRNGDKILMPPGDSDFIIVLSWTKVKQTQRYIIQVSKDREFKNIVLAHSSTDNRHTLSRGLKAGRFYWRVKSTNSGGNSGENSAWSEPGFFYINK